MAYISQHQGTVIDEAVSEHNELRQIILDTIYPIGSLYTSFNSTSPESIVGGTWEQIKDCFLMAAGSSYAIGTSGGSASHTHTSATHTHTTAAMALTVAQMPKHYHTDWHWGSPSGAQFGVNDYGATGSSIQGNWKVTYSATTSEAYFYTGYQGSGASHSHGDTGSTTPDDTGASSSLPPYQTIYMWKRTA